jgi:hypothetical protein
MKVSVAAASPFEVDTAAETPWAILSYLKRSDTPQDSIEVWRKCQLCSLRSGIPDDMRAEAQNA